MNLYEQQTTNRRQDVARHDRVRRRFCCARLGFDAFFIGRRVAPSDRIARGARRRSVRRRSSATSPAIAPCWLATAASPIAEVAAAADDGDRLKLQQLDNVVDEMAIAAGVPRPPVYVVPDRDPNAFATGRGPGHASIAVTAGPARRARPRGAAGRRRARDEPRPEPRRARDDDRRRARRRRRAALRLARRGLWWGGGVEAATATTTIGRRRRPACSSSSALDRCDRCSRRSWRSCSP